MKIRLYMKSGNQIVISGVKNFTGKYKGNEVTQIQVSLCWWKKYFGKQVLIGSIDLSQIEAIVRE